MPIYELEGQAPIFPASGEYYVAETATLIGRVRLGHQASIWPGAVLRGDNEWIDIGEAANVQDNSTLHTDIGQPLVLGARCTVGHNVILHGCIIGEGSLVGMGSIVMNGARIGRHCVIGAGALVTEGKEFPDRALIVGSPARVLRTITEDMIAGLEESARHYAENGVRHRTRLRRL